MALLLVALLVAAATAGCGDDAAPEPERLTLESDGLPREALVVPGEEEDGEPAPLVLAFHGLGSDGAKLLAGLKDLPERTGATIVLPNGLPCAPGVLERCWPAEPDAGNRGAELRFVERLVDRVAERWPVDRERVYAFGLSNGGAWTMRLLLDRPDLVRGGIVVAGYDPTRTYARGPNGMLALPLAPTSPSAMALPDEPRPLIIEHGTADAIVPYPLVLELYRRLQPIGWPSAVTRFHPLVGVGHFDPGLLDPFRLQEELGWMETAAGAPPAETTPAAPTAPPAPPAPPAAAPGGGSG